MSLNFSSTTSLWSLSEMCFCQWTNSLFTIYISIYIHIPRFLSERQREKDDKRRRKRKTKINCEREAGNSSTFKKWRKDSILGVFRAKHDPYRGDRSSERGEGEQESSVDRQIYYLPTICHSRVEPSPSLCTFGIEISTPPTATIFEIHPLWRGLDRSNFISLTRWLLQTKSATPL